MDALFQLCEIETDNPQSVLFSNHQRSGVCDDGSPYFTVRSSALPLETAPIVSSDIALIIQNPIPALWVSLDCRSSPFTASHPRPYRFASMLRQGSGCS